MEVKEIVIQNKINRMLSLMSKALRKVGHTELEKVLKGVVVDREFTSTKYDVAIDYILESVVQEWSDSNIKKADLYEYKKRGEVTVARKMAIILIKQHLQIPDHKISIHFGNRCRQVVYNVLKEYKNLSQKNRFDISFIEKHKKIETKILPFIASFKKEEKAKRIKNVDVIDPLEEPITQRNYSKKSAKKNKK